jgi:hypothetical protein
VTAACDVDAAEAGMEPVSRCSRRGVDPEESPFSMHPVRDGRRALTPRPTNRITCTLGLQRVAPSPFCARRAARTERGKR